MKKSGFFENWEIWLDRCLHLGGMKKLLFLIVAAIPLALSAQVVEFKTDLHFYHQYRIPSKFLEEGEGRPIIHSATGTPTFGAALWLPESDAYYAISVDGRYGLSPGATDNAFMRGKGIQYWGMSARYHLGLHPGEDLNLAPSFAYAGIGFERQRYGVFAKPENGSNPINFSVWTLELGVDQALFVLIAGVRISAFVRAGFHGAEFSTLHAGFSFGGGVGNPAVFY